MNPTFFATPEAFRAWLERHHSTAEELQVGFHKKDSGTQSVTWPEAVDQALCFGWIDGVRRRIDDARYAIRFTPRRRGSTWSAVNIRRVAALEAQGRMRPAGRKAFAQRSAAKSRTYSYERRDSAKLDAALRKTFMADPKAWAFFLAQAPFYQRKVIHWVVTAKKKATRVKRLHQLIDAFSSGRKPKWSAPT